MTETKATYGKTVREKPAAYGEMLTVDEAAAYLGMSRNTILARVADGTIPNAAPQRPGAKRPTIRIRRADLEQPGPPAATAAPDGRTAELRALLLDAAAALDAAAWELSLAPGNDDKVKQWEGITARLRSAVNSN
jgi:excisionase family DNA binding protein